MVDALACKSRVERSQSRCLLLNDKRAGSNPVGSPMSPPSKRRNILTNPYSLTLTIMADQQEFDSILDIDLESVPEMTTLDADTEVELRVESFKRGVSKKGENYIMFWFEVPSDPTIKSFSHYFGLGSPEDSEKQRFEKLNDFREFGEALGLDMTGRIDLEDFRGQTIAAIVGVQTSDQYGTQNTIKRFIGSK